MYKFLDNDWVESDTLSVKDVVLYIDKEDKIIYIWDGVYSSARKRVLARDALSKIKLEYSDFKFRLASSMKSDKVKTNIKDKIQDFQKIRGQTKKDKKSLRKIIKIMGIVSIILITVMIGYLVFMLNNCKDTSGIPITFEIFKTNEDFTNSLLFVSILASIVIINLGVMIFISMRLNRQYMTVSLISSLALLFLEVYYHMNGVVKRIFSGEDPGSETFSLSAEPLYDFFLETIIITTLSLVFLIFGSFRIIKTNKKKPVKEEEKQSEEEIIKDESVKVSENESDSEESDKQ